MFNTRLRASFDPSAEYHPVLDAQAARYEQSLIPTEEFRQTARSLLENFDGLKFRALCKTAIAQGLTSVQSMEEQFPGAIPRNVDKTEKSWPLPSPVVLRSILNFYCTLEKAEGQKKVWRHASPRPAPEPDPAP